MRLESRIEELTYAVGRASAEAARDRRWRALAALTFAGIGALFVGVLAVQRPPARVDVIGTLGISGRVELAGREALPFAFEAEATTMLVVDADGGRTRPVRVTLPSSRRAACAHRATAPWCATSAVIASFIFSSPERFNVFAEGRGRMVSLDRGSDDLGIGFGGDAQLLRIRVACLGPSNATLGAEGFGEVAIGIECEVPENDRLSLRVRVPVVRASEPAPIRLANYGAIRFSADANRVTGSIEAVAGAVADRTLASSGGGGTSVSLVAADRTTVKTQIRRLDNDESSEPEVTVAGSRIATFLVDGDQGLPRRWYRHEEWWLALLSVFSGIAVAALIELLPPPRRRKGSVAA